MKVVAVFAMVAALAQLPPRFTAEIDLVQLDVVVLDAAGQPVEGLTASDFALFDNTHETPVEVVSEVRIPGPEFTAAWMRTVTTDVTTNARAEDRRLVMIVLDDGRLPPFGSARTRVQEIAREVIGQLGPQDLASVVFIANNRPSQDFTADRQLLLSAIDAMGYGWGRGTPPPVMVPASIDVLSRSAANLIETKSRRKVLVYVGTGHRVHIQSGGGSKPEKPGADPWGLAGRTDAVMREAQRAGVAIYAIDPYGSRVVNTWLNLPAQYLNDLSAFTGGFATVGTDNFSAAVDRIFDESSHYYVLGFRPAVNVPANAFRRLRVDVKRPGVTVRTRSGYYTPPARDGRSSAPDPEAHPVTRALAGILPASGIPLTASLAAFGEVTAQTGKAVGHIALILDLGTNLNALDVEVRVFDPEGRREFTVDRHRSVRPGLGLSGTPGREMLWTMPMGPGRYSVRAAVHDPETGLSGSVYGTVTVPDFAARTPSASGVFLASAPSPPAAELTPWPSSLPHATVRRRFHAGDAVRAVVRIHHGSADPKAISARLTITDAHDNRVIDAPLTVSPSGSRNPSTDVTYDLPLRTLPAGQYLLRFEFVTGRDRTLTRTLVFTVEPPEKT